MKILIIGSAGVGKTHLFHLLSNTPPPDVRQSTPVMKRPVQVIQTTLKSSSSLKSVTDQELYELLASTVNKAAGQYGVVGSSTFPHINVTTPDPSSQRGLYSQRDMRPSSQGCIHEYNNDPSLVHGVEVPHMKPFQDSSNGDPSMLHKVKETHMKFENHSLDNGIPNLSEVEEQLIPYKAMTKDEPLPSVLIPNIELSHNDDPTELEQELIPYIANTKDAAHLVILIGCTSLTQEDSHSSFNSCLHLFTTPTSTSLFSGYVTSSVPIPLLSTMMRGVPASPPLPL